jgi:hypothetical protein
MEDVAEVAARAVLAQQLEREQQKQCGNGHT